MHVKDIHLLYEFNFWAKRKIMEVVKTLSAEQFMKDMCSSHGGIQGTLVHTIGAEHIWLKRWKGDSPGSLYTASDFPSYDAVEKQWDSVERDVMEFCRSLSTDQDILKTISYKDMKGNPYAQPLWQLMQHLVNHSSYHRGQVVTMLRQAGIKPVGTDMVAFYRQV